MALGTSAMQTLAQRLANPTRFMALSGQLLPWISVLAGVLIAAGLYMGFAAPLDYQQGHAAKIMYVHVPAAWLSCISAPGVARVKLDMKAVKYVWILVQTLIGRQSKAPRG